MGTDAEKKQSSVMKTLKMRFRSKASLSLENKGGDSTPLTNSREFNRPSQSNTSVDEEFPTETDTVSPSKVYDKSLNPKLVVRATRATTQTAENSTEFSDPYTAPHLIYMTSYGGNMNYSLKRAETKIGRKDDNHIILTDATISKFHAVIYRKHDGFCFF